jgi:Ca-activated chloride channel homolog
VNEFQRMSDKHLDPLLRDVPLPDGLLDRLRQVARAASHVADDPLDARLRRVDLPVGLTARLLAQRSPRRRQPAWGRLSLAAAVVLAIGLAYSSGLAAFVKSGYRLSDLHAALAAQEAEPLASGWVNADSTASFILMPQSTAATEIDAPLPAADVAATLLAAAPVEVIPDAIALPMPLLPADTPLLEVVSRFPREAFRGMSAGALRPDELRRPPGRGVEPPAVAAYPLQMQLLTGVHPAVSPAADPQLRTSRVPLSSDTTSFDAARLELAAGVLPAPSSIRTEDFLAALDYNWPPPAGQLLALHVAGGPSPFGQQDLVLLHLAVQAATAPDLPRAPAHLTLAVDVSAGMREAQRLEMVRRGVASLMRRMSADDRLSLVIFRRQAETLVEYASRDDFELVRGLLAAVEPRSETDVVAGLRAAFALAEAGPLDPLRGQPPGRELAQRVVLISDGGISLEPNVARRVDQALAISAEAGIGLAVIDLGGQELPDSQLAGFARAAGGPLHRAVYARQMDWALLQALTGQPQTVAADCSLSIEFDPRAVAAYRLMGHEGIHADGWAAAPLSIEMRSGQTSTGLYELRLLPSVPDIVGVARLRWRDPASGAVREEHRTVRRADFAPTIGSAPVSLQLAAIAAETAEQLRQSYFAQFSSPDDIGALARLLGPEFARMPSVRPFLEMSFQLLQARPPGAAAPDGPRPGPDRPPAGPR